MDRKAMYKMINSKKAVMIGCGFVGSASVFALMQSGLFTEIVLIDADNNKARRGSRCICFCRKISCKIGDVN